MWKVERATTRVAPTSSGARSLRQAQGERVRGACARGKWREQPRGLPLRAQGRGPFDRLRANGCGARVHVDSGEGNHEGCPYVLGGAGPSTGSGRTGAGRGGTLVVERATTRVAPTSSGARALLRALGGRVRVACARGTWRGQPRGLPLRAQGHGPFDRLRANGCGARVHVGRGEGNHEGCPYELRGAGPSTGSGRTGAGRVCSWEVERATTRVAPTSSGARALREAQGERVVGAGSRIE